MIRLKRKINNPYTVENMQKALDSLRKDPSNQHPLVLDANYKVIATHYYLRFKPKNEEEMDILSLDSTMILYSFPLDYEIVPNEGHFYHDPKIPVNKPTYQYCTVSTKRSLPSEVEYEVLDELYVPVFPDSYSHTIEPKLTFSQFEELERISLIQTNNFDLLKELDESIEFNSHVARKWRPAGRIRFWDDGSFEPIEGVRVLARRWIVFTGSGLTDSNGYYSCDRRFRRPANYIIKWDRYQFSVRADGGGQAFLNGPKKKGDWNLDLRGWYDNYHATIFRAAHHYYYKDIKGLRRPPQNGTWRTQMKIKALLEAEDDCNGPSLGCFRSHQRLFGLGNPITISNYGSSKQSIYSTTIHELAHASHWKMSPAGDYHDTDPKVKESWAIGVQWVLVRMAYPNYLGRGWSKGNYTLVVADMIDDDYLTHSPVIINHGYRNDPKDQVYGYTIRQIEDAMRGQETWNSWRDNIISKYYNPSEHHLTTLFKAYE